MSLSFEGATESMCRLKRSVSALIVLAVAIVATVTAQPSSTPLVVPYPLPSVRQGTADFGDMDGDGRLDLAVSGMTLNGPRLSVWHLSDSSWSPGGNVSYRINVYRRTHVDAHAVSQGEVRWGDFDADGDDDLLVTGLADYSGATARYHGPLLDVYENNGLRLQLGARALSVRRIELPGLHRSSAKWGDYDGDGDLDIVAAGLPSLAGEEPVTWLFRNDQGTFVRVDTSLPGIHSGDLDWGDFDGDGDLDLALMGDRGGGVYLTRIYRNDGGEFVDSGTVLPNLAHGSLEWGDYDGDGDVDLLLTGGQLDPRFLRGVTKIFRNDGGTLVDGAFGFEGHALGTVRWGDVDRDGDLDVFAVGAPDLLSAPVLRMYAFDGERFVPSWHFTGVRFAAMDVADYNGDGDADLFINGELSTGGSSSRFLMNRDYFECVAPSWVGLGQSVGNC